MVERPDLQPLYAAILALPTISGIIIGASRSKVRRLRQHVTQIKNERDKIAGIQMQNNREKAKLKTLLDQESGLFVDNWDHLVTEKDKLREEAEISSALLRVAISIGSLGGPKEVLKMLTSALPAALFADNCLIFEPDETPDVFVERENNLVLRPGCDPVIEKLLQEKIPVTIEDMAKSGLLAHQFIDKSKMQSAILIPCVSKESVRAIAMVAYTRAVHDFTNRDLQIATGIVNQTRIVFENANLYGELLESHNSLKRLMNKLASSQEDERRRISRDLHDGVIQNLSGMLFTLNFLENSLTDSGDQAQAEIKQLENIIEETTRDLRKVIYGLRPTMLDSLGLGPTLEKHLERFEQDTGVKTTYNARLQERLEDRLETGLFRLAQEALNNTRKHAQANNVELVIERDDKDILMLIKDDGRGFDPGSANSSASQDSGFGLSGMCERVESLSGNVKIASKLGEGTEVRVTVPFAAKES